MKTQKILLISIMVFGCMGIILLILVNMAGRSQLSKEQENNKILQSQNDQLLTDFANKNTQIEKMKQVLNCDIGYKMTFVYDDNESMSKQLEKLVSEIDTKPILSTWNVLWGDGATHELVTDDGTYIFFVNFKDSTIIDLGGGCFVDRKE